MTIFNDKNKTKKEKKAIFLKPCPLEKECQEMDERLHQIVQEDLFGDG